MNNWTYGRFYTWNIN